MEYLVRKSTSFIAAMLFHDTGISWWSAEFTQLSFERPKGFLVVVAMIIGGMEAFQITPALWQGFYLSFYVQGHIQPSTWSC